LIDNKLFNYEDLLKIKFIKLVKENYGTPEIRMNSILADILIENLINNAIKHNIINGEIIINIKSNEISISNTGNALTIDPLLLFKRFSKSNSQSFGLGLSIVKEICEQNHIDISYKYNEKEYYYWHTITLLFSSNI
jgi:signal transduction histidine kinase